jgi:hypothetical protein
VTSIDRAELAALCLQRKANSVACTRLHVCCGPLGERVASSASTALEVVSVHLSS